MTSWKSIEDAHALPSLLLIKATTIDLENLRDLAWASAHKPGTTRTVYWDEPRSDGIAFCFEDQGAAWTFANHCAVRGIPYSTQWPKNLG